MTKNRVLVAEDEDSARFIIDDVLRDSCELIYVSSLAELRQILNKPGPTITLALLDLSLEDGSVLLELQVEPRLRAMNFIVISSTDDPQVLRECLSLGAIDYLTKPFNANELMVKVEKALKETSALAAPLIDESKLTALGPNGESVPLTAKEYQIYKCLCVSAGEPVPRRRIMESVWGKTQVGHKTLDVHLHKLRKKVEPIGLTIRFLAPDSYILSDGIRGFF